MLPGLKPIETNHRVEHQFHTFEKFYSTSCEMGALTEACFPVVEIIPTDLSTAKGSDLSNPNSASSASNSSEQCSKSFDWCFFYCVHEQVDILVQTIDGCLCLDTVVPNTGLPVGLTCTVWQNLLTSLACLLSPWEHTELTGNTSTWDNVHGFVHRPHNGSDHGGKGNSGSNRNDDRNDSRSQGMEKDSIYAMQTEFVSNLERLLDAVFRITRTCYLPTRWTLQFIEVCAASSQLLLVALEDRLTVMSAYTAIDVPQDMVDCLFRILAKIFSVLKQLTTRNTNALTYPRANYHYQLERNALFAMLEHCKQLASLASSLTLIAVGDPPLGNAGATYLHRMFYQTCAQCLGGVMEVQVPLELFARMTCENGSSSGSGDIGVSNHCSSSGGSSDDSGDRDSESTQAVLSKERPVLCRWLACLSPTDAGAAGTANDSDKDTKAKDGTEVTEDAPRSDASRDGSIGTVSASLPVVSTGASFSNSSSSIGTSVHLMMLVPIAIDLIVHCCSCPEPSTTTSRVELGAVAQSLTKKIDMSRVPPMLAALSNRNQTMEKRMEVLQSDLVSAKNAVVLPF